MTHIDRMGVYIFNPEYSLYPDKNRILLTNIDSDALSAFFIYVHPMLAIFLSHFDGKDSLENIILKLRNLFGVSDTKILEMVEPLLENDSDVYIKYDNGTFIFPKNTLIHKTDNIKSRIFNPEKYLLPRPYDFTTTRLNLPKRLLIVLNTKCYTDCIYCYADRKTKYTPMSLEKLFDIIDNALSIGVRSIDLSGGEIFNYKDWELLLAKLIKCGYPPYISTKIPLTEKVINRIWELGIKSIQISLDTLDPTLVGYNLKVEPEYVKKIKNTLNYLNKKGISITLKSTVTKHTCTTQNIKSILEFAEKLENMEKYIFTPVNYSHYKSVEHFNSIKPALEQVQSVVELLGNIKKRLKFVVVEDTGNATDGSECGNQVSFKGRSLCTANQDGFVILPDGKVTICEELYWNDNFIIGDTNKSSLEEIWCSSKAVGLFNLKKEDIPHESICRACDDLEKCRQGLGVCWKMTIASYGRDKWLFPDVRCPKAPKPYFPIYYDNSFLE